MTSRLFLHIVNSISLANYNTVLHYYNKPVRIRLSQLTNVIRTERAVQEENKLGTVSIF